MTPEIWKPVVGHPGYEVSSLGNVRSSFRGGRVLRPGVNRKRGGYRQVNLAGGIQRRICVLVAAAFLGPRKEGQVARHKNGEPSDDRAENLEWGTQGDNNRDAVRHGTFLSEKRLAHLRRIAHLGGKACNR
jgi:hypothetical protein